MAPRSKRISGEMSSHIQTDPISDKEKQLTQAYFGPHMTVIDSERKVPLGSVVGLFSYKKNSYFNSRLKDLMMFIQNEYKGGDCIINIDGRSEKYTLTKLKNKSSWKVSIAGGELLINMKNASDYVRLLGLYDDDAVDDLEHYTTTCNMYEDALVGMNSIHSDVFQGCIYHYLVAIMVATSIEDFTGRWHHAWQSFEELRGADDIDYFRWGVKIKQRLKRRMSKDDIEEWRSARELDNCHIRKYRKGPNMKGRYHSSFK